MAPSSVLDNSNTNVAINTTTISLASITTTNPNDLILTWVFSGSINSGAPCTYSTGGGSTLGLTGNFASNAYTVAYLSAPVTFAGTFTPFINNLSPCNASWTSITTAWKAATSPASGQPIFGPLTWNAMTLAVFPGLSASIPSAATGDTQIDLHVGTPINAEAVATAYPGNNAASTMYVVPVLPSAEILEKHFTVGLLRLVILL